MDHTFSPVGRPTGNIVAERVIQTLAVELAGTTGFESIDELRVAVAGWTYKYNDARPHRTLKWHSPAQKRAAKLSGRLATAA